VANSLLTPQAITRQAIRILRNSNAFLRMMDTQYDDQFANSGAPMGKIGTQLRIRMPNDYIIRTGPTAVPQDTVESNITLTLATQAGVDVSFSSVERTMTMQDFSRRVLEPAMNVVAAQMSLDVIAGVSAIPNFVSKVDGSNNIISPDLSTWATAGGILDNNLAPRGDRVVIVDPITQARTVSSFSTLFNNQAKIGDQYTKGIIGRDVLGFDWAMDQNVPKHTTGAYSTLGTVAGANQTGSAITTSALAGPLVKGDIITFAGVFAVNRVTKVTTGVLRQFTVTANVAGGATSIPIYPALTPTGTGTGATVYGTVTASPANGAAITVTSKASEVYRQNFAFARNAVTLATADLELPRGVHEAYRDSFDGISMRLVTAYNVTTDQFITRFDVLYGYQWLRPEWAVIVADAL
jgi:hypothetical protein